MNVNFDRLIGILGLLISSLSLLSLPKYPLSWFIFSFGLICIIWSIYKFKRKPLKLIKSLFEYEFSSRGRKRVKGKKITVWKVTNPNITRIESGDLTSTGYYENFTTNIGRLTVENRSGGLVNVICDLGNPLTVGEKVEWILAFDLVDSFKDSKENVAITADTPGNIGVLYLKFSPKDPPKKVWKSISKQGKNEKQSPVTINNERPELYWRFKIKHKNYYSFNWEW